MDIVIIGASAAGISCAETIREKDKKCKITVISREDYQPVYSRCMLSYYLAGDIPEEKLQFRSPDFYQKNRIEAIPGVSIEKVDPRNKTLKLSDKKEIKFDQLLIATGSSSKFPKIPGIDKQGVLGLRTFRDAQEIRGRLKSTRTAAILGGGLIGLKAAYGISRHIQDIRVIVKSPQVLSQMIDKPAADIFQDHIEKRGIKVMTGLEAVEVMGGKEVAALKLDNGEKLDCQMVIVGKGVKANIALVEGTGINTHWGIMTDEHQLTSVKDIYAAGDCAETRDLVSGETDTFGLWPLAMEQGRIAGLNMAGEKAVYDGSLPMNSVEFFDLPVISFGLTRLRKEAKGFEELTREDRKNKVYKKVIIKDNQIRGAILVGKIDNAGVIASLLRNKIDISPVKEQLLEDGFDFGKILPLIEKNKDKFKKEEYQEIVQCPE